MSNGNILYYDNIAADYDAILNKDSKNEIVRNHVAQKFVSLVKSGEVLDFGGGTGRDFGWLLRQQYSISFCEPSAEMRRIAMKRQADEFGNFLINYLEGDQTDFRNWSQTFPFDQKMDAVLANFAVFNCIPDIKNLLDKLSLLLKPGGIVLAVILESSLKRRLRSNLKATILSSFSDKPVEVYIDYRGERQIVYLHTIKAIKKAAEDQFEFVQLEQLRGSKFSLIHLMRK